MITSKNARLRLVLGALLVLATAATCTLRLPAGSEPTASPANDYAQGSGGVNAPSQRDKPYLVLVSIDGFRWDYMDRHPTPNLHRIARNGARAERLLPVFPTLTFPNHYSIATGLYPAHHGLTGNEFPDHSRNKWYSLRNREMVEDGGFYGGQPIWVTAETQGMVSASFFWVGTEAAVNGVSPTHWRSFNKDISGAERVDQVLRWMAQPPANRPHLYTLYFEDVDDHSHWYGPGSEENIEAISRVDAWLGRLLDGIDKLPYSQQVNIIVVSDHGQGPYLSGQEPFMLGDLIDLSGMTIIEGGSYLFMHFDHNDPERAAAIAAAVNETWRHGHAYTSATAPAAWVVDGNPRFPDVMLIPEQGYAVLSSAEKAGKINAGDHGWAPESPAMHGLFIASGPNIKPGVELGPVRNIDIYPLMLSILGLDAPEYIDGDPSGLSAKLYSDGDKHSR